MVPDDRASGWRALTEHMCRHEPREVTRLVELARARGLDLPSDYLEFMGESNGGEGGVGSGWIEIWPVDRVLEAAERDGVPYEDFIAFAGDGANTVYGFDLTAQGGIVEGDWIGLGRDQVIPRGSTLLDLLHSVSRA
jgi:hypothetical protein